MITMKTVHGKTIVKTSHGERVFGTLRDAWLYALIMYDLRKAFRPAQK